ncbi:hypothetical protein AMJ83_05170 [candidate division WOR_3 bacterium SM23_42]|uniref:Chromosome partition protein Smc n=1 Tax=candidate division WOR_3 bacterium SM23_42 TaxID=1703779 RepID=A0A0S8FUS6_UNCW3|nr:MAG: hypothetical protein AMJ83_05170 [candidate division WOR_3 bacterium SM23_42]
MKIKEIKMYGFKSFREETKVLLNTGITAFVGPNGSGKSNIFDALRWVFGEQSMKALRCERIEDLVYMSSDTKEDANFTEVAVTIDNEDYFPQFGSEFEIKRRFYRTGDSEFFLNRVKCRLQDIQALFLNSGALTYSFLELAEVERIIHGDTKEMFDDVAGILKYQERKEQTKRRLDATEQDLLRLEDIIAEMRRGLRGLRRQVRQASLYNELRTEYKHLMLYIMANDYQATLRDIETVQAEIDGKETERQAVLQAIKQLEKEREELKSAIECAETEKKSSLAQIMELNRAIEVLQNRITDEEAEVTNKTILSERVLTSIKEKQELVNSNKRRVTELENERNEVNAKIDSAQSEITELQTTLDAEHQKYFSLEKSLKDNEGKIVKAVNRVVGAKSDVAKLRYDKDNKENILSHTAEELATHKDKMEKVSRLKKELEKDLDEIIAQQNGADDRLKNMHEKADELEARLHEMEDDLKKRNDSMADCRIMIDTLKHRLQTEGKKKISEKFGDGLAGMFKDSIDVASGYESVVDICLSDLLSFYLLKEYKPEDFSNCPDGRFGFIPMKSKKTSDEQTELKGATPIVRFVKFITAESILKRYVQNYFLVDDHNKADELSSKYPAYGFVTADGILFKDGTIVVEKGEVGYFKIKQSHEEYKQQLESLRNEVLFITEDRQRLNEEIEQVKQDIEETRNQLFAINVRKSECSLRLQESTKEIEQKTLEWSNAKADQESMLKDNEAIAAKIKTMEQSIEQLESEKEAREQESQRLAAEMTKLRAQMDDMNAVLNRSTTETAVLDGRKNIITQSIGKLHSEINGAEAEIRALREESLPTNIAHLTESISTLKHELSQKRQKKSAYEAKLPDQLLEEYSKRQGLVYDQLMQKQKDHEGLQDQIMQLKYQLFEKNHRREDLTRKADDEFAVVLSEYIPDEEISDAETKMAEVKGRIEKLGEVNPLSLQAFEEEKKRLDEFIGQRDDIITAKQNLLKSIEELDQRARERFNEIFQDVREQFNYVFSNFFEDGQADLILTDPENPLASKVEIVIRMMGRRLKTINQLSGGQKTLLAISLLLAFYLVKPAPFCILDEIDAPLDDINVVRFSKFLRDLSQRTQVVIITHNRATMEYADYLYGLTMEKPRESKVISAKLADLEKIAALEE